MPSPTTELAIEKLRLIAEERSQLDASARAAVRRALRRVFRSEQEAVDYERVHGIERHVEHIRTVAEIRFASEEAFLNTLLVD